VGEACETFVILTRMSRNIEVVHEGMPEFEHREWTFIRLIGVIYAKWQFLFQSQKGVSISCRRSRKFSEKFHWHAECLSGLHRLQNQHTAV